MTNLFHCDVQAGNNDQNTPEVPSASLIQENSQVKVNSNLKSLSLTNLNYCDVQASTDDQTAGEGPTASLIQDNSQTKVDQNLKSE